MAVRLYDAPCFGRASKSAVVAQPRVTLRSAYKGAAVSLRDETTFASFVSQWGRSAASVIASTDGRWALVSTSVTALIAGSVAWLAMGTAVPTTTGASASRSLIPYELFQRLSGTAKPQATSFASLAPLYNVTRNPLPGSAAPEAPLDDTLNAESAEPEVSGASSDTHTITMESGQSLASALMGAGATPSDVNAAIIALEKVYNVRALRAGQTLAATFAPADKNDSAAVAQIFYTPPADAAARDEAANAAADAAPQVGKLLSIAFSPTIQQYITITRGADGTFAAQSAVKQLEIHYHRAGAKIDSSLYLAAMQAGIPAPVVVQMIHMF